MLVIAGVVAGVVTCSSAFALALCRAAAAGDRARERALQEENARRGPNKGAA